MTRAPAFVALCAAALIGSACSADGGVANVASDELDSLPSTTDPPSSTDVPSATDPPSTTGPTGPTGSSGPPLTQPPDSTTPGTVDVEVPPDCVELPDGAPAIIVTDDAGIVYQVGTDGTQVIADSEQLPSTLDSAWRTKGGALWVTLDPAPLGDSSIGHLDATGFTEVATGNVNVQHVGEIDDTPVALWFDYGGLSGGARAVLEDADGKRWVVAEGSEDGFALATGGIGGNGVALSETSVAGERFRYLDAQGALITDWFNPTKGRSRNAGPPEYLMATPSPDGAAMSWVEGPSFDPDSGATVGDWQLVVAATSDGSESFRRTVAGPDEFVSTADYDGRWYLASFSGGTVLIDTTLDGDEAVSVPCIPAGSATLDRGGGGGDSPPPPTSPTTTTTTTTAPPPPPPPPGTATEGTDGGVNP